METNGFVFLRSYYDAINDFDLTPEQKGIFLDALFQYVFDGVEPQFEKGIYKGCWTLIKPTLDNSINRYRTSVENGKKGGAPKGTEPWNKGKKSEPKANLLLTENEPNTKLNKDKEKDKEKEKDMDINMDNNMDFDFDTWVKTRKAEVEEKPKPIKTKSVSVFDNLDI